MENTSGLASKNSSASYLRKSFAVCNVVALIVMALIWALNKESNSVSMLLTMGATLIIILATWLGNRMLNGILAFCLMALFFVLSLIFNRIQMDILATTCLINAATATVFFIANFWFD